MNARTAARLPFGRPAKPKAGRSRPRGGPASGAGLAQRVRTAMAPLALTWLGIIFLIGGGSRGNIASLMVLRPAAAIIAALALFGITRAELRSIRTPLVLLALLALATVLQLLPLPFGRLLEGRELAAEGARLLGLGVAAPVSQVPFRTWNALYSLIVPLSALLLFARVPADRHRWLVGGLVAVIAVSALLAAAQLLGPRTGPLYFYDVTNVGGAVGLFANRNHQAILLAMAFPAAAAWALSHAGRAGVPLGRRVLALALAVIAVPLVLATGSRGGLLLALAGLAASLMFLPSAHYAPITIARRSVDLRWLLVGVGAALAPLLVMLLGRIESIERFSDPTGERELRSALWPHVGAMIRDNLWTGGGMGTFADVYRRYEPDALLSFYYVNHVHNDLLELFYELGIAGAVLIAGAAWLVGRALWRVWSERSASGNGAVTRRLAGVVVLILAAGSLYDYPLRVPSLAALGVIALALLIDPRAPATVAERGR